MTPAPQLVYLAFGAETYQREAVFSIVSALAHSSSPVETRTFEIQVFTDSPMFYKQLPVRIRPIEPGWDGPHQYHFRIKHAALQAVLREHGKAVLIDTDTFFRVSPERLFERVVSGSLVCNAIGAEIGQSPELPDKLLDYMERHDLADPALRQTNSGVIGMVDADTSVLDRSIMLMDELRPLVPNLYTLEEFSLALAAHGKLQLISCTDIIHHYWSRKAQFRAKIEAWYAKHHQAPLSPDAIQDSLLVNDRLPRPPQPVRSIQKLLTAATDRNRRQFLREILYGCHAYPNEFDRACSAVWWDKALANVEERRSTPLSLAELDSWLASPIMKLLAGNHYAAMREHLLRRLKAHHSL